MLSLLSEYEEPLRLSDKLLLTQSALWELEGTVRAVLIREGERKHRREPKSRLRGCSPPVPTASSLKCSSQLPVTWGMWNRTAE